MGGYVADAVQSLRAQGAIRLLIGPLPVVVFIAAILLIQRYPLDEKAYKTMMAESGKE
jgi:Na+/melibiose symporter-like transporter